MELKLKSRFYKALRSGMVRQRGVQNAPQNDALKHSQIAGNISESHSWGGVSGVYVCGVLKRSTALDMQSYLWGICDLDPLKIRKFQNLKGGSMTDLEGIIARFTEQERGSSDGEKGSLEKSPVRGL